MEILYTVLVLFLVAFWMWFRAYNAKRLALARLDIAKVVLEMDELMLAGETKAGDVCHDRIYGLMMQSQRATRYDINWRPWEHKHSVAEMRGFLDSLKKEIEKNPKIGELCITYIRADFCAFRNSRPIMALIFSIWIGFCLGGFLVALKGLMAIKTANQAWSNYKLMVAEIYYRLANRIA